MSMTKTVVQAMIATRPKIMMEIATATRREIGVETIASTRLEIAVETMEAISPGPLTGTGAAATVAAATVAAATAATIITSDKPQLRKRFLSKKQASRDESRDARQPSPRTALPPRESLEPPCPFVHVTLVTVAALAISLFLTVI